MSNFVHLHLHSVYSLLDGAVRLTDEIYYTKRGEDGKIEDEHRTTYPLCEALIAHGMDAVAITDHGNLYGVHTFVSAMRKNNIKPIIGSEFYVAQNMYVKTPEVLHQRNHLILLAKNKKGYENLMKLSTASWVDGFYMKPRIDLDLLAKHSEGLICCSACLAGYIPNALKHNNYDDAKDYALRLKGMFEEGDFYIELQDHGLPDQKRILNQLVVLAREIGVKVVATNDVHYIDRKDADTQDTMMCITLQCKKNEKGGVRFENDQFYLKSGEEMEELFSWIPEAIESTREIADKVDGDYFVVKYESIYIPNYQTDDMNGRTPQEYLYDLAWEGIKTRYDEITDEIEDRLNYELGVIDQCGFNDYFLIVWDFVNAARLKGIPVGPGRGSGAGSLVAYAIGITDVDPLKYSLLFERFLSRERVSNPDFDIDFCYVRRPEIIDYVVDKYGAKNVSQIIAYSTMSAKQAIKDVGRVYDIPYTVVNNWVKTIPNGKVKLSQCLDKDSSSYSADFTKLYLEDPQARAIVDTAMALEGMPRQASMHAAGVVICRDPIVEHVPLSRNGNEIVTQFDKGMIEMQGLLKMDFLGLKTLTDIAEALKYIKEDKGIDINFDVIDYDDPKVYETISSGDCEAIFQLESGGMRKFMAQLQPTTLEDVMAGISMYRPGPMQFLDLFLEGKRNPAGIKYDHPALEEVLSTTYGCIVYQEQVMQIAQKLAGYSFGGADIMRRAISKKKVDDLKDQKKIFMYGGVLKDDKTGREIVGAVNNGVSERVASDLFDKIMRFAGYAFNKSHAAAYAVISYRTAYLKCYYPMHYITAVINDRINNADEVRHYINYLKRQGVKILPPDINHSMTHFSIDGENVRYGLMGIKNVGESAVAYILKERKERGDFADLRDFLERCQEQINKRLVLSLIKGGAFDSFGKTRATLTASYEKILDGVIADKKKRETGQLSFFDFGELVPDTVVTYTELSEYDKEQILADEKEVLGMYISGHPLEDYPYDNAWITFHTAEIAASADGVAKEVEDEAVSYLGEETNEDGIPTIDRSLIGKKVCMGCVVESHERKLTTKQQHFAVGRLEDWDGAIEFAMYSRAYEEYGHLLETDKPLRAYGKLELRDESDLRIIVEKLDVWEQTRRDENEHVLNPGKLYLYVRDRDCAAAVAPVLAMFPGNVPVFGQFTDKPKAYLESLHKNVEVCDELMARLANIVGETGIVFRPDRGATK